MNETFSSLEFQQKTGSEDSNISLMSSEEIPENRFNDLSSIADGELHARLTSEAESEKETSVSKKSTQSNSGT